MRSIEIYLEGGGQSAAGKAALRQGMDRFLQPLKDAARARALRWKLVPCGSRNETFDRFRTAIGQSAPGEIKVLLVDAEGPVAGLPRAHLRERDGWDLNFAHESTVHLMVQFMETWIVADPEALTTYYDQSLGAAKLPKGPNLEKTSKKQVERALRDATKRTTKGAYHKIRHASQLLKRIDARKARARCSHCDRLFEELGRMVEAA